MLLSQLKSVQFVFLTPPLALKLPRLVLSPVGDSLTNEEDSRINFKKSPLDSWKNQSVKPTEVTKTSHQGWCAPGMKVVPRMLVLVIPEDHLFAESQAVPGSCTVSFPGATVALDQVRQVFTQKSTYSWTSSTNTLESSQTATWAWTNAIYKTIVMIATGKTITTTCSLL